MKMASYKGNLGPKEWEQIVINNAFGMSYDENAASVGISASAVRKAVDAFEAVKADDWAQACNLIVTQSMGLNIFKWAAGKLNKQIPETLEAAYRKRTAEFNASRQMQKAGARESPAAPGENAEIGGATGGNEILFFQKIIEQLCRQNELLESLLDVVLPKYIGDLKDNVNANCDVIAKEVRRNGDHMEAIKLGLRKRGL